MSETVRTYDALFQKVAARTKGAGVPCLIGIAGPPATGKSTLAERLVADLNVAGTEACFCPMDGFHLTNAQLDPVSGIPEYKVCAVKISKAA